MAEWGQFEIDDVREAGKRTARAVEQVAELMKNADLNDRKMLDVFNAVAKQLEALTKEIKGLREDLAPKLDKPSLPGPSQKA